MNSPYFLSSVIELLKPKSFVHDAIKINDIFLLFAPTPHALSLMPNNINSKKYASIICNFNEKP
jgi:hypothetical protein